MDFSISTIAYDWHKPIDSRLAAFHNAGFTAIDWTEQYGTDALYGERDAAETLRLCRQHGLRIATVHGATHLSVPYTGAPKGLDALWLELNKANLEFAARVGAGCIVLHLPSTSRAELAEQIRHSREMLDGLRPCADMWGVKVALENSPGAGAGSVNGDYWPNNRELLGELLESYPAVYLGWCFDSGHAHVRGDMDMLDIFPDRLIATHLHDNYGISDQHLLPREGSIHWPTVITGLKRSGFAGPLNLEVGKPESADAAAWCHKAYQRIRGLWDGGAKA